MLFQVKRVRMEEVEQLNSAAIESCFMVIDLLSQPRQCQNQYRGLVEQTGEAVLKFKKVVSLLNSCSGHARVRKTKKNEAPSPHNIFLENPVCSTPHELLKTVYLPRMNPLDVNVPEQIGSDGIQPSTLGDPYWERSYVNSTLQRSQQTPVSGYGFFQQHQQRLQFQQQQQAEFMYRYSSSEASLNFESSSCTPTMSLTRSFISSLSIDGSVANFDGRTFNISAMAQSGDRRSYHHKRCTDREGVEVGNVETVVDVIVLKRGSTG